MKNCFLKDNAFFMILLFFLTVLLGCPPDAVVPENKEPVINSLTASATTVEAKTKITLTCVASDPENASLTYTWQASIGTLASTSGDKTEWTAPASPCSAIMTVNVSDGSKSISKTLNIQVVEANGPVTEFKAVPGNNKVFLSWTNPSTAAFAGVKILRKTDAYSINSTDGTKVYSGTGIYYEDTGLANGTKYYYTAYSFNANNEFTTEVTVSGTPDAAALDTVAPPEFNSAGGDIDKTFNLSITSQTSGSQIFYTTDGTTPSVTNGFLYSGEIPISESKTLKAVAVKSGYNNSSIKIVKFTWTGTVLPKVNTPSFNLKSDTIVSLNSKLTINCSTVGAELVYTTDDSDPFNSPTSVSTKNLPAELTITTTTKIKVYAKLEGYTDSEVAIGKFLISKGKVATPLISPIPATGVTYDATTDVTISCLTEDAVIKYTINSADDPSEVFGTIYDGKISLTKNSTIKAVALKKDYTDSDITTQIYKVDIMPKIGVFEGGVTEILNNSGVYEFEDTAVNKTTEVVFIIKNSGSTPLQLTGTSPNYVTISGTDAPLFSVTEQPSKNYILPKTTTSFKLSFTPDAIGSYSATVTILSNDKTFNCMIKGKGSYVRLKNWTLEKAKTELGALKCEVVDDKICAVNLESRSSSDVVTWTKYAGFLPVYNGATESYSFGGHALIKFNGALYSIGGMYTFKNPTTVITGYGVNKVYKSTTYGESWITIEPTYNYVFPTVTQHTATIFNNKVYVIGGFINMSHGAGDDPTYEESNQVWYSSDCKTWTKVAGTVPFEVRANHQTVVFNNKLWLIGGELREYWGATNFEYSDIWYSQDGETWIKSTGEADFGKVTGHKCFVYDNKLWLFNGKWIWYSVDGETWKLMTSSPAFGEISGYNIVQFNNKVYLIDSNNIWVSE